MKKRVFAVLLSLCLLVELAPAAALAAEEAGEETAPVCAALEGCGEGAHGEGCPLYADPDHSGDRDTETQDGEIPAAPETGSEDDTAVADPEEDPAGEQVAEEQAVEEQIAEEQMDRLNAALSVSTLAEGNGKPAGPATVSLQDENAYYPPTWKKIDIATADNSGTKFVYYITVNMKPYFAEYIEPLIGSNSNGKFESEEKAKSFTITFPAELFDSELLEIDWTGIKTSTTSSRFTSIKTQNATDGVVLQGAIDTSNNAVTADHAKSALFIKVPVTLPYENYQDAAAKGQLDLKGMVTVESTQIKTAEGGSLQPLLFSVDHTIVVEDSENLLHSLTVKKSDGTDAEFEGIYWNLTEGEYTVSGEAQDYEGLKVSGNATITLDSATIRHISSESERYAPAISIEPDSQVELILSGENTVVGGSGCAGIFVDPSATLTISGDGTLNATGGNGYQAGVHPNKVYAAGGAGIGGNGIRFNPNNNSLLDGSTATFGTIIINSGKITAVGGDWSVGNTGGGAGIGTGGNSSVIEAEIAGNSIQINGGEINATGGRGDIINGKWSGLNGGGAGIGSGGCTGGFYTQKSVVDITISGGTVTAVGKDDGAGIGGGGNVNAGTITITGGNVTATGGCEIEDGAPCEDYGGAGIGGGDEGSITSITITGGTVVATGAGASAGIGQGAKRDENGYPGEITIGGDANVTATGGSVVAGYPSGAGIGGGRNSRPINITLGGSATVNATGGAYAAGIGTAWKGETATIIIEGDAANVTATGGKRAAGIGTGQQGTGSDITISGKVTVNATGGEWAAGIGTGVRGGNTNITISGNALVKAFGAEYGATIGSAYMGGTVSVHLKDTAKVYAYGKGGARAIGEGNSVDSDAASLKLDDTITLWAQSGDADYPALPGNTTYNSTDNYLVSYNDAAGAAVGYLTLPGDTSKNMTYSLTGDTLTIEGNRTAAIPIDPVGNWATIYGKPVPQVTIKYVLGEGETGAADETYADETVMQSQTVTVKKAPTKDGYTFTGWSAGTTTYQPGETLTVTAELAALGNITLTAQWSKNGGSGGSGTTTYCTLHYESNGGTRYRDERYTKNTVVKLNKFPTREGYVFAGWYADEELTEPATSVKMTKNETVYALWRPATVPDLLNGSDHFAYVVGYPDGTVRPMNNISRAQVATIFFRLLQPQVRAENLTTENTFTDVNEGMWCNTAVSTMAKLGIVLGRTPERFDPDAAITRAEFAVICARFDTSRTGGSNFTDIENHWAEAGIERAVSLGWIRGYTDGTFRPNQPITRAEAMTMINRMLCRIPEDEDDLLPDMNVWLDNRPGDGHYLAVQEATNSHDFRYKGEIYEYWTELNADPDWTGYQD